MKIARTVDEVRATNRGARERGASIGFVPTMGFLHEGHLSLVDLLRREGSDLVVASIFVNPKQFNSAPDLEAYPRDESRDLELFETRGVDLVFSPDVETIYPEGFSTSVVVRGVSDSLEGQYRPGHFEGVTTIVARLFQIVQPDLAAFGRKDAQQCAVVKRMVEDLGMPVRIVLGDTVREEDGLAMSSRNARLSTEDRDIAPALHRALVAGRDELQAGGSIETVERAMAQAVARYREVEIDYLRLVDPETFRSPLDLDRNLVLAGAIRIGSVRLIDNIPVTNSEGLWS